MDNPIKSTINTWHRTFQTNNDSLTKDSHLGRSFFLQGFVWSLRLFISSFSLFLDLIFIWLWVIISNTLLNIELKKWIFSFWILWNLQWICSLSKAFGRCVKSAWKERGENCSNIKVISESTIRIAWFYPHSPKYRVLDLRAVF